MPTTIHVPASLLTAVDRRAKALRISRNRLIVQALEQAVNDCPAWSHDFLNRLRDVDPVTIGDVDQLATAAKRARRSKIAPAL